MGNGRQWGELDVVEKHAFGGPDIKKLGWLIWNFYNRKFLVAEDGL